MKMPRNLATPPSTSNKDAQVLMLVAKDKCEGCRLSWRLKVWRHGEPMPIECVVKLERQELRDIAARGASK